MNRPQNAIGASHQPVAQKTVGCPVETTIAAIGGRWKVLIIHHLLDESKRFGQLFRQLPGISRRTLTRQLRELEASGVVDRQVADPLQVPPKADYSLTPLGQQLQPILFAMHAWGVLAETAAAAEHVKLGSRNGST